jgi:hypothetical protein
MANLKKALSLLIEAGFIINWEKSSLISTTNFTFLGMIWDFVEGALSLPQDKLLRLRSQASLLLSCPSPPCPDGVGGCLSQGGASPQAEGEVYSAQSELRVLFGAGFSKEGDAPPKGEARPSLDDAAPDSALYDGN